MLTIGGCLFQARWLQDHQRRSWKARTLHQVSIIGPNLDQAVGQTSQSIWFPQELQAGQKNWKGRFRECLRGLEDNRQEKIRCKGFY